MLKFVPDPLPLHPLEVALLQVLTLAKPKTCTKAD